MRVVIIDRVSGKTVFDGYIKDLGIELAKDITELVNIMKSLGISRVGTDHYGYLSISVDVPKDVADRVLHLIYRVAHSVDELICGQEIRDVNIVPIRYSIKIVDNTVVIHHDTEWDNA